MDVVGLRDHTGFHLPKYVIQIMVMDMIYGVADCFHAEFFLKKCK